MTNQQINRAIAEACGWKESVERYVQNLPLMKAPPDYCNDLNAMHEAEKTLTDDQFKWYTHWVEKLMPETKYRCYLCATASQRAEAFVRSLGKWEEVQL
jgi:hypothetical protein